MLEKLKYYSLEIVVTVILASVVLAVIFIPQDILNTYESPALLVFLVAGGFFLIILGRRSAGPNE